MKQITKRGLFFLAALVLYSGCSPSHQEFSPLQSPSQSIEMTPVPDNLQNSEESPDKKEVMTSEGEKSLGDTTTPRISLPDSYQILNIFNMNLDYDHTEEQVILVRDRKDPKLRLKLVIGDYDDAVGFYKKVWEGESTATINRAFTLSVDDLTGDHNLELISRGITSEGNQTLDIYQRIPHKSLPSSFRPILSLSTDGSLEIQKSQRSESYNTENKRGVAFPVISTRTDPRSDNPMDLIRETYLWQPSKAAYQLIATRKLPAQDVEAKQLREIYSGNKDQFLDFIKGAWYKESAARRGELPRDFIYIDPNRKQVFFYNRDIQEIYDWTYYSKPLYKTVNLLAYNTLIPSISKYIYISLVDMNQIDFSIQNRTVTEDTDWEGRYIRISRELKNILLREMKYNPMQGSYDLQGVYKSNSGEELTFDPPRFQLSRKEDTLTGGFTVFQLDKTILQLKALRPNGRVEETMIFEMDYETREDELRIIKTLYLYPVVLHSDTSFRSDNTMYRFEQIIQKESRELSAE